MVNDLGAYDLWLARGVELQNDLNKYDEALDAFNKAIEIKPESASAWAHKAQVLYIRDREESIKAFQIASTAEPDNPAVLLFMAMRLHYEEDKLVEPLELVDRSLQSDPDSARAWLLKGEIFDSMNWLEEAVAAFDKAVALGSKGSGPCGKKGWLLIALNRYQEAVEAFDLAISRNPKHYNWWNGKGVALAKLKRYDAAIAMYDQALERCSDSEVWYNKGISLMMLGRYEEALGVFDKSLELYPDYAPAWNNKSWVFRELDRLEDAKRASARAIEIDPDMVNPDYCNAKEAVRGGNRTKALEYLRKAMKRNPETIDKFNKDPLFKDFWEH